MKIMGGAIDYSLPDNVVEVMILSDGSLFYSASMEVLYIYPASYHPGTLQLSKDGVLDLLRVLKYRGPLTGSREDLKLH